MDKEFCEEDLQTIDGLIEDLKRHEEDLRVLRQEIERQVRSIRLELYKKTRLNEPNV